jgi:excisionase family DNA binding protein
MQDLKWLRPDQAADYLAVSKRTVYRLAYDGEFVCAKVRGSLRIRQDSVHNYMHRQAQNYSLSQVDLK